MLNLLIESLASTPKTNKIFKEWYADNIASDFNDFITLPVATMQKGVFEQFFYAEYNLYITILADGYSIRAANVTDELDNDFRYEKSDDGHYYLDKKDNQPIKHPDYKESKALAIEYFTIKCIYEVMIWIEVGIN